MIEVERVYIDNPINESENPNSLMIYSINANDILIEKLTILIQYVIEAKTIEELELLGLTRVEGPEDKKLYYEF